MNACNLTAVVLTKNSEKYLAEVIKSIQQCTDCVLVIDSGSTDNSVGIAKALGATVVEHPWPNSFADQRNFAHTQTSAKWILAVDSDEIIDPELADDIRHAVQSGTAPCYTLRRKNELFGLRCNHGIFAPDDVTRLYQREICRWVGDVHERLECPLGKIPSLSGTLIHRTYSSFQHWQSKVHLYTDTWAKQHSKDTVSLGTILSKSCFAFIKAYFLKLGFLDGRIGFVTSLMHCYYTFEKYTKLYDASRLH